MSDDVQSPVAVSSRVLISRSIWPARIVLFVLGTLTLISLSLFAYQTGLETYPGSGQKFAGTAIGALHVGEHLLRGLIALVLAFGTWRYLRVVKGLSESIPASLQTTLVMLWRSFAGALLIMITYGTVRVFLMTTPFLVQPEPEAVATEEPAPEVAIEFRLAGTTVEEIAFEAPVADRKETVWLQIQPILTNEHIRNAVATTTNDLPDGDAEILLEFTSDGSRIMEQASNLHIGGRLAVLLDDRVVMAPRIDSPLRSRASIRLPGYSHEDVERIARSLTPKPPR